MRLIDSDAAAAFAENCGAAFVAKKLRDGKAFPEAVVRCGKCEYVRPEVNRHTGDQVGVWCCLWDEINIGVDDYCSHGKPKEIP